MEEARHARTTLITCHYPRPVRQRVLSWLTKHLHSTLQAPSTRCRKYLFIRSKHQNWSPLASKHGMGQFLLWTVAEPKIATRPESKNGRRPATHAALTLERTHEDSRGRRGRTPPNARGWNTHPSNEKKGSSRPVT